MLLKTGAYSDLTIKCGKHTFHVHKNIVFTRSEYFATACKPGAFKVRSRPAAEQEGTLH